LKGRAKKKQAKLGGGKSWALRGLAILRTIGQPL
jgi:hypothetical protein